MKRQEQIIQIPTPKIKLMKVKIKGTSPLIFNRWTEKATKMILDKQMKKANSGREIRSPEKEYEASFYKTKEGKIAMPALWLKQAMINSGRFVNGLPMTLIRGMVFIEGDSDGLIPLKYKNKRMRTDTVRIGMGTTDLRFRGELTDWSCDFILKYNEGICSAEQILNLLQLAGLSSGLGEWRAERGGTFGSFEIVS